MDNTVDKPQPTELRILKFDVKDDKAENDFKGEC